MQYRKFGRLDWQGSALGFGCMRLPLHGNDPSQIDETEATNMLHYAIDHGVNYLDTAYPYHGGQSEIFVGKFLKTGYWDQIKLATKMPGWLVENAADFDRYLDEQLAKLQTEYIDFYLLHGLGAERWHKLRDLDVLEWAERAIADGRIGQLGFSFHDKYEVFQEIVDAYEGWAFCQIQYNYMDIENQAGTKGLRYAASKGLAVVIMEPILGGRLVNPPPSIQSLWDAAPVRRSPADWALQWIWNQPEVTVVLSGMSTLQQVIENVASAQVASVGCLTQAELDLVERVRTKYHELSPVPCTKCDYCMPCPNGVNIPRVFEIYNQGIMYDKIDSAGSEYQRWLPADQNAGNCIACLDCEQLCPQMIPISEWMPRIHEMLGQGV